MSGHYRVRPITRTCPAAPGLVRATARPLLGCRVASTTYAGLGESNDGGPRDGGQENRMSHHHRAGPRRARVGMFGAGIFLRSCHFVITVDVVSGRRECRRTLAVDLTISALLGVGLGCNNRQSNASRRRPNRPGWQWIARRPRRHR